MTNYTELKRLAEDCKNCGIDFDDVSPQQGSTSCDKLVRHYLAAASPDVTLQMIDALDVQAGSIEAVQAANQRLAAERDKLRTQNQALELDAKRYRYWRENHGWTGYFDDGATNSESNDDVDKAIDAAIAQAEGGV